MRNLGFTWLDVVALVWFFAWWVGYSVFAIQHGKRVPLTCTVIPVSSPRKAVIRGRIQKPY